MATFGQIRQLAEQRYPGVATDLRDQAINSRYFEILNYTNWRGLRKEGTIQTTAEYATGTVAITNGSTTVTGTGTTFTSAMTGREIRVAGRDEFYEVTYVSATELTLSRAYEGGTVTESAFKIFQRIYALASDVDVVESVKRVNSGKDLEQVSQKRLDETAPSRRLNGKPECWAVAEFDGNNRPQAELYPIPSEGWGIPYFYVKAISELSATADVIAGWIPTQTLLEGVFADLAAIAASPNGPVHEAKFQSLIRQMAAKESRQRPGRQLRMASRFTRHRTARGR